MIDLTGFPFPDDAPEPGACVRIERPEPGLAVVVLDPPHRKLTVLDGPVLRDLDAALDELERDVTLSGVVITGRAPDEFAVGADVKAIESVTDPALIADVVRAVHGLFRRIAALRPRTVAAVGGPVPGGAYELSLACDCIVATDSEQTRIGLPETQLGIIPAWGGCHRLPKRVGLPTALAAILTGKLYPAKHAKKLGLVDRLTKPAYLAEVAAGIALGREVCRVPARGWRGLLIDRNPIARAVIVKQSRKQVLAKTRGHYPAPLEALQLVAHAPGTSLAEGMELEAAAAARLAVGPVAKSLIAIFFASEAAKKLGRRREGVEPRQLDRAGVIGGGVMGAGIASLLAERGVATRIMDLSRPALDAALGGHRADVERKRKSRRLTPSAATAAVDRLDGTTELIGFGRTQIVIEAIAEKLDVKRAVFAQLAAQVPDDAILATNTSSLSVDAIAEGLPHPERFCGMHFFNPVKRMPLVEVVRGSRTSERTVTEVAALALRLGKTPVVVKDVPGFLVNRILGPYLDEAVRLFVGGVDPAAIELAMLEFGMPMGPFALLDEVGLDIALHAADALHEAYGERMTPCAGLFEVKGPERLGKKTGLGFYRHGRGKPELAGDLRSFQRGDAAKGLGRADIVDRLVLAMVNEAARCLAEDVVAGARELDLATVFGTGFAPFRGGLLAYADSLGTREVVQRLERIAAAPDVTSRPGGTERFTPARLLVEMAESGRAFHDPPAQAAPSADLSTVAG